VDELVIITGLTALIPTLVSEIPDLDIAPISAMDPSASLIPASGHP